jgi:argininosuccinate lyase
VALAETTGVDLPDLPLKAMQSVEARITRDIYKVLGVENSVASRRSFGGTAPGNVRREARRWLNLLKA